MEKSIINEFINTYSESIEQFSKQPFNPPEIPITYEFTNCPELLSQYYEIREECYRTDLMLENFCGEEDQYDKIGHILIVRKGNIVLGGARLVISTPIARIPLPLEEMNFTIANIFPYFYNIGYCEFSRLAISSEFRKKINIEKLVSLLINKAHSLGCKYAFAISPLIQARHYDIIFRRLGYPYKIIKDILLPYKPVYSHLNSKGINLSIGSLRTDISLDNIIVNNAFIQEIEHIT